MLKKKEGRIMNKRRVLVTNLDEEKTKKLFSFLENELAIYDYEVWNNDYYDNVVSFIYDFVKKNQ